MHCISTLQAVTLLVSAFEGGFTRMCQRSVSLFTPVCLLCVGWLQVAFNMVLE